MIRIFTDRRNIFCTNVAISDCCFYAIYTFDVFDKSHHVLNFVQNQSRKKEQNCLNQLQLEQIVTLNVSAANRLLATAWYSIRSNIMFPSNVHFQNIQIAATISINRLIAPNIMRIAKIVTVCSFVDTSKCQFSRTIILRQMSYDDSKNFV